MKTQPLTACKQYCLAPAHAGQHKATSPTRKTLCATLKDRLNYRWKNSSKKNKKT